MIVNKGFSSALRVPPSLNKEEFSFSSPRPEAVGLHRPCRPAVGQHWKLLGLPKEKGWELLWGREEEGSRQWIPGGGGTSGGRPRVGGGVASV